MGQLDGLNRGGNEGNVYGAGRKRNAVRNRYLKGADLGAKWLVMVAAGKAVIDVYDAKNKPSGKRPPTFEEQISAIRECAKYGLGSRIETVRVEDLTDEQLIALLAAADEEGSGEAGA